MRLVNRLNARSKRPGLSQWLAPLVATVVLASACAPAATPAPTAAPKPTTAPAAAATTAPAAASPVAAASPAAAASPVAAASPAPAATTAPVASGPATKMTVSYSNIIGTEIPLWYGFEKGIFKKNGLDLEITLIESTKGMPALLAGQTTAADIGGAEALSAAAEGADITVVSITGPVYPYVFLAPADVTTPEQLKGKTVAVSSIGGSADIATRVGLRKVGLDPEKDVNIIATGSVQNRTAAMLTGQVQGGVGQPPDTVALEQKGFHVLYDMAKLNLPATITSTVFQRSYLNSHKADVQKFVDSIVESTAQLKKDKLGAIEVLKKYYKSDDEAAMNETYDYFVGSVLPQYPTPKPEMFKDAVDELGKKSDKVKSFDLSKLIDQSFGQNAADRKLGDS